MKQIIPESRVDGNATAMTMSFAAATNSLEAHVNVPPELKRLAPVKRRFLLWGVAIVSAGPAAGSRPGDRTAAAGKHAAVKALREIIESTDASASARMMAQSGDKRKGSGVGGGRSPALRG